MALNTLNLCSTGKASTRDGHSGEFAHIMLPFYTESDGFWFANGQLASFPGAEAPQFTGRNLHGRKKANTYRKDCCSCLGS